MDDKKINVLIVHYNTPFLTKCLVKSINKFTPGCNIFIFDNSDREPFINEFDNVTILDNTKGKIIDFDAYLKNFPDRMSSGGKANNFGSFKHCISVEKSFDLINDSFFLMDSDILLKRDIRPLATDAYLCVGDVSEQIGGLLRISPFLCYLNVPKCKQRKVTYFNKMYMHGLYMSKAGDKYDTGAWLYKELKQSDLKKISLNDYIIHYRGGSWESVFNKRGATIAKLKNRPASVSGIDWAFDNFELWNTENIIVSMTSWAKRIGNIPSVIDSILNQTMTPTKIVLNLSVEEFPELEKSLPTEIIDYINKHNIIELNWVEGRNTKQWKKFIPTMKKYPNDIIICIDDDKIYQNNLIETLCYTHLKYPNHPIQGGGYIYKGFRCHSGPCSLIRAEYFKDIDNYLCDELYDMHSSDMFFTYLAAKNGYMYINCEYNFENNAKKFNEIEPMHLEKTNGSKITIMWDYLTKKYGNVTLKKTQVVEKRINTKIGQTSRQPISAKKTNPIRKIVTPVRPTTRVYRRAGFNALYS